MDKRSKVSAVVGILGVALAVGAPLGVWLSHGGPAAAATAEPPRAVEPTDRIAEVAPVEQPVIYVAETVISEKPPVARKSQAPARKKAPCKARDEGRRPLVQGSGEVRTWTFCH